MNFSVKFPPVPIIFNISIQAFVGLQVFIGPKQNKNIDIILNKEVVF